MEKTLFSTPELAQWLGVFHTTVRRWIERGRIRGIRVGRNYKIPADEVIRILDNHGIPLPDVVRRYREKFTTQDSSFIPRTGYSGSILQKLLVVEDIEDPAFVCRKTSILGANRPFADMLGYSQADLIGLDLAEVLGASSADELVNFAKQRIEKPEKGPFAFNAYLKTSRNQKCKARVTAGALDHMKDVYLLVVKDV